MKEVALWGWGCTLPVILFHTFFLPYGLYSVPWRRKNVEGLRFKLVAGNYSYIYKKGTEREDPNLASVLVPFSSFWKKRNHSSFVPFLWIVPECLPWLFANIFWKKVDIFWGKICGVHIFCFLAHFCKCLCVVWGKSGEIEGITNSFTI